MRPANRAYFASCPHDACMRADDKFRANFLWGRKPMLAACAARLANRNNMIWVDLGGGTGVSGDETGLLLGCW